MNTTMTIQQRRDEFAKLLERIPGETASDKLNWLEANDLCSRQTAMIWKMRDSKRPPPANKLRLMARLLK